LIQNYTHIKLPNQTTLSTCGLEAWDAFSCSSRASPILSTTDLALAISAQAKDFSWLTNFLASSEAYKTHGFHFSCQKIFNESKNQKIKTISKCLGEGNIAAIIVI